MAEPAISLNAVEYTLCHLFRVAFSTVDVPFLAEFGDRCVTVSIENVQIYIPLMDDATWETFLAGQKKPVLVDNAAGTLKIPVFRCDSGFDGEICKISDHRIECSCDLISPAFALLSRYEEFNVYALNLVDWDEHDRIPFEGTLADKYDLVEIPLADEYAMLLRTWLCQNFPDQFHVAPRTPRVVPTHDIDLLYRFDTPVQSLKSIFGRDLLINRDLKMVWKSWAGYRAWKQDFYQDPYIQAILEFAKMEHAAGLEPVFFFKSLVEGDEDVTYDIRDVRMSRIWKEIKQKGGIVGLHGSYKSAGEEGRLRMERKRLESELGTIQETVTAGRQHYLRTFFSDDPNSLDLWQEAGIIDDYTLGFAERCGFRCGTCHPYPLYDVRNDRVTDIIEHPLIVMDGTLFDYMKLSVEDARTQTQRLKQRCFDVEGDFVILWHNHATTREFEPYFNSVYLPLLTNNY